MGNFFKEVCCWVSVLEIEVEPHPSSNEKLHAASNFEDYHHFIFLETPPKGFTPDASPCLWHCYHRETVPPSTSPAQCLSHYSAEMTTCKHISHISVLQVPIALATPK